MLRTTDLELRPISPALGAEVLGVDLRDEPSPALERRLLDAWNEHALLLFRGQSLSDAQVDRVCSIFGRLDHGRVSRRPEGVTPENDPTNYVSNVVPDALVPTGELNFHMDSCFAPVPLRGISLYCYEAPPEGNGGETLFANAKLVYDALPAELKARIEHLQVIHSTAVFPQGKDYHVTSLHPIVFPHPVTGEKVVFCSPNHFLWIVGMDADAARALCAELASYFTRPEVAYKHSWRPGDLVVWDNMKLQHARTNFDPRHRRHLRRMQIATR